MATKIHQACFIKSCTRAEHAPPARPSAVFAGRSNVGKSSLINALTGRKGLARTSNTPGRTREVNFFDIDGRFYFVDLPGYGYAQVPLEVKRRWGPMIERFLRKVEGLRLMVIILDARRTPGDEERQLIGYLEEAGVPYLFAINKADKLGGNELRKNLAKLQRSLQLPDDSALIPVSARTGAGLDALRGVILDALYEPASEEPESTGEADC